MGFCCKITQAKQEEAYLLKLAHQNVFIKLTIYTLLSTRVLMLLYTVKIGMK